MRFDNRIRSISRFFVLYACLYGAFGVASPFWPRFFEERGLTAQQLGILLASGTLIRLVSGPLAGRFADATGQLPLVLAASLLVAAASAASLLGLTGFWFIFLVHLVQSAALAPTTSIADALALKGAARLRFEYGRLRGVASAVFVVATICAGYLIAANDVSVVVWFHTALLLGAGAIALSIQPHRAIHPLASGESPAGFALHDLWKIKPLRSVVLVSALVYGSHALHDAFAMIRWNAAGIAPTSAGFLWAEAVAAEVVMFTLLGPLFLRKLGAHGAAALAAAAGVIRWVVMASSTSVTVVAMVQPLHGFTFALMHLACMRVIEAAVPQRLAASSQAAYALGSGLMSVAVTALSGYLYAGLGGTAFLLMAFLCALACPLAWRGLYIGEEKDPKY